MKSASEMLHQEAAGFGIKRPSLEYKYEIDGQGTTVISLTDESEKNWADYMRAVNLAKLTSRSN